MNLSDFHYTLPEGMIARYPLPTRSESRLLCVEAETLHHQHRRFFELLDLLQPNDLLVFNDTKVLPARLFGHKPTGGRVEILIERLLDNHQILVQLHASKSPKVGSTIHFDHDITFEVITRQDAFYVLQYHAPQDRSHLSLLAAIETIGKVPLPHYMHREPDETDRERYQTVYAKRDGSVAVPSAGLHFDEALLAAIKAKGVNFAYLTLHIGAGTFAPIRVADPTQHQMHAEYVELSEATCDVIHATKAQGGRVIVVGTTTLRALESASQSGELRPFSGETRLFIYPGVPFHSPVDVLITNLHLPGSTLLMLVCALGGQAAVMDAYTTAVREGYRFYTYGDAMWVPRDRAIC